MGIENIFKHRFIFSKEAESFSVQGLASAEINKNWKTVEKELQKILKTDKKISRIEGYDISNISGKEATGSMVVFNHGLPDKKEYRQFRIKKVKQVSDVDMIKEILERRVKHAEWTYPDLILIDGGKPQLSAALSVVEYNKILQRVFTKLALQDSYVKSFMNQYLCKRTPMIVIPLF